MTAGDAAPLGIPREQRGERLGIAPAKRLGSSTKLLDHRPLHPPVSDPNLLRPWRPLRRSEDLLVCASVPECTLMALVLQMPEAVLWQLPEAAGGSYDLADADRP